MERPDGMSRTLVQPVNDVLHQNVVVPVGPGPPVDLEENDAEGVHVTLLGSSCQHLRIPAHGSLVLKSVLWIRIRIQMAVMDPDPYSGMRIQIREHGN